MKAPLSRVKWSATHRLILSKYPPIDLFDDVADPHDWEALARAEARTNPAIFDIIGDLAQVPPDRRLTGPGAGWVMAAFTHISPDRKTRFSDGSFGVYYAAGNIETALHEHVFHMQRFYAQTNEGAGWICEVRQLVGKIDAELVDLRHGDFRALMNPDSYIESQAFGAECRRENRQGIVYPSPRNPGGECIAAFFPDVVSPPVQGDHFRYHWNGTRIDYIKQLSGEKLVFEVFIGHEGRQTGTNL